MSKYERVFGDLPPGRSLDRGVVHIIELEIGKKPITIHPYRHIKNIQYYIEEAIKKNLEGKPILLRGMHTYLNQMVVSHHEVILRHGDIEWHGECLITFPKPHLKVSKHTKEI